MVPDNINIVVIFAAYLLFMISIGVLYYKKTENLSDYILGGRKLKSWVTALSAQASDMSGWLLLGLP
jgi:sodium/proline symporter